MTKASGALLVSVFGVALVLGCAHHAGSDKPSAPAAAAGAPMPAPTASAPAAAASAVAVPSVAPAGATRTGADAAVAAASGASQAAAIPPAVVGNRPNILLIVADDLGYSDLGVYGSEIATPNLDRLARGGIQFTQFYASPFCSPTRAMLMSGADNHRAGLGDMAELISDAQRGHPGYEGYLNERVLALPELLRASGYRTVMAGKWHLGNSEAQSPAARGFDRSYAMTMGGASHYGDQSGIVALDPAKPPKAMYRENGRAIDIPRTGFYSSDAFTSKLIAYLDETRGDGSKPFFAYLAFTAPHWPLQAPEADIAKYQGRYDKGYEAIRQERLARMKQADIIPKDSPVYKGHAHWPGWNKLTPEQKRADAKRMTVYAAMVDHMDQQIGRLLAHLEQRGQLDNTVIFFMSDNGADGNSVYDVGRTREWIHHDMDNSTAHTGKEGSFVEYGLGWAQVGMTPLHLYKSFVYEGGISVPAIAWGPKFGIGKGRAGEVAHVMDVAPTFYQLAGAQHPGKDPQGRDYVPVQGRSMLGYLRAEVPRVHGPDHAIGWELGGRKALRKGDWKIVQANAPWGTGQWELYNIARDRTESRNLAASQPDKLKELEADWREYVRSNGVLEIDGLANRPGYSNAGLYYQDLEIEARMKPRSR